MIHYLRKDRWSPFLVGVLLGLLLTITFVIEHQIGASSGIARIAALIEQAVAPSLIGKGTYFHALLQNNIIFDWKVTLILGVFLGSLVASLLSKEKAPPKNTLWKKAFGTSKTVRYCSAFIGGVILMLGARIANGCTSGHAISGGAQLSITSWVFMIAVFASAIPFSFILYKKIGGLK